MQTLLPLSDAAKLLGIKPHTLRDLARRGHIRAYPGATRTEQLFSPDQIEAYDEVRKKYLDLAEIAAIARQAFVTTRALEREVERLRSFIGVRRAMPRLDPESVVAKHTEVEEALNLERFFQADEIWNWACFFYGIGEEYFEAVAEHTSEKTEPWQPYLNLSERIIQVMPPSIIDAQLQEAYGYFAVARQALKTSAYFYIRNKYGQRMAGKLFPEAGDELVAPVSMFFR